MQQSVNEKIIQLELSLPHGEGLQVAKVVRRYLDENGKMVCSYSDNPIFNSLLYEVEFPDGTTKPYAANIIAQHIHDLVDGDGRRERHLIEILDFSTDIHAISKKNRTGTSRNGIQ